MKRLLIFCLTIFWLIACKKEEADADLTAKYLGVWEASLPTDNTDHIWTIEKIGKNQIKILIREHTEFNFQVMKRNMTQTILSVMSKSPTITTQHSSLIKPWMTKYID